MGDDTQIRALGQVLPQRPVEVLEGTLLLGAVRIEEVDLHAHGAAQLLVPAHLRTLVVVAAAAHGLSNRFQFGRKALSAEAAVAPSIYGSSTKRLVRNRQRRHRGIVACAFVEVPYPAAVHQPVYDHRRAQVDADHVGHLPPAIRATGAGHAGDTAWAQTGDELPAHFTSRQGVDADVNGSVGHVTIRLIGEDPRAGTCNLLGRPLLVQQGVHQPQYGLARTSLRRAGSAGQRVWQPAEHHVSRL